MSTSGTSSPARSTAAVSIPRAPPGGARCPQGCPLLVRPDESVAESAGVCSESAATFTAAVGQGTSRGEPMNHTTINASRRTRKAIT
jgi:hypothetical protein